MPGVAVPVTVGSRLHGSSALGRFGQAGEWIVLADAARIGLGREAVALYIAGDADGPAGHLGGALQGDGVGGGAIDLNIAARCLDLRRTLGKDAHTGLCQ